VAQRVRAEFVGGPPGEPADQPVRPGGVSRYSPRVLDTSALLLLFSGHPRLMRMLNDAEAANSVLILATLAIAEAEAALDVGLRIWEHFLRFRGVRSMELTEHTAIEAGRIAAPTLRSGTAAASMTMGPWMVAQAVWEAQSMNAPIVTQAPAVYAGHEVALSAL
jgi:hypothetical protein